MEPHGGTRSLDPIDDRPFGDLEIYRERLRLSRIRSQGAGHLQPGGAEPAGKHLRGEEACAERVGLCDGELVRLDLHLGLGNGEEALEIRSAPQVRADLVAHALLGHSGKARGEGGGRIRSGLKPAE